MGTTAAGITLNDEKFGMLCGNYIAVVRSKIGCGYKKLRIFMRFKFYE